jgi:hypothetical protein
VTCALFDADRLVPQTCGACGATRQPDEQQAPACAHDRDTQAGVVTRRKRPHQCLNAYDPTTAQIPF